MSTHPAGTAGRAVAPGREPRPAPSAGETLALFADWLIVGCLTTVAALGVLTAFPALVAGAALLRDRGADDVPVGVRSFWARLRGVARSGPAGFLAPLALVAVLAADTVAVLAGVPGGLALGVLLALVAAAAAVLGLRVAGLWRPGLRWGDLAREATGHAMRDLRGDLLLLGSVTTASAVVALVPVTVLLMPGMLALAAAAVRPRAAT